MHLKSGEVARPGQIVLNGIDLGIIVALELDGKAAVAPLSEPKPIALSSLESVESKAAAVRREFLKKRREERKANKS